MPKIWTQYVVNSERENQTLPPSTALKTTHPIPETCPVGRKEKEILTVKHTWNISYPETQKLVEGYIKKTKPTSKSPKIRE